MTDFTDKYNTSLSKEEEKAFQKWLASESEKQGRDVSKDLYDYDLRGFFKAGSGYAENGHGTDRFKKPNHPTFSKESQYHGKDGYTGGEWIEGNDGKFSFYASDTNLKFFGKDRLQEYFNSNEKESQLVLPLNDEEKARRFFPISHKYLEAVK